MPIDEERWNELESVPSKLEGLLDFVESEYPNACGLNEIINYTAASPHPSEGVKRDTYLMMETLVYQGVVEKAMNIPEGSPPPDEPEPYYRTKNPE